MLAEIDQQLVGGRRVFEQNNLVVKLTMLGSELDEFVTQLSLVDALHWPAGQCPI